MMRVLMLAYPGLTQLDLTAPWEVFVRSPELEVRMVARERRLANLASVRRIAQVFQEARRTAAERAAARLKDHP